MRTKCRRLLAIAGAAVAVTLGGPVAEGMAAIDFAPAQSLATGIGPPSTNSGVAAGDFDSDGDIDLVAATCGSDCGGTGTGGLTTLPNNGSGTFGLPSPQFGPTSNVRAVLVADMNEDGDPDLVTASHDQYGVLLGGVNASFGSVIGNPTGPGTFPGIAVGDVNNDGHLDLVNTLRTGATNVQVRLGDGTGALGAPTGYTSGGTAPYAVALADVDVGGSIDMLVANSGSGNVVVRKNSAGTFGSPVTVGAGGEPVSIAPGQFLASILPDLAVANRRSSAGVLLNASSIGPPLPGIFLPLRTLPAGSPTLAIASPKLQNLSGSSDLVSRQQDGTYHVWLNDASAPDEPFPTRLTLTGIAQPANAESQVIAADVNGDAALDLIGTNYGTTGLTLFRQLPVVSAAGVDFDDQTLGGRSAERSIAVTNTGQARLDIASDAVGGTDAADFVKTGDDCAGTSLRRGQTCHVLLRFKPSALGARAATLTLTDNAKNGSQVLALAGTGVAAPESVPGPTGANGANGANGPNGANGANGADGQPGANGANGANGQAGPQGDQGPQGAQGSGGAQGPKGDTGARGPAGRDATVKCKPGKKKKGRVRVTCTVRFAARGKARARLSRNGVVYAHGSGRIARHAASLDLRTVRRTPPGKYTMHVRFGSGRLAVEIVTVR